MVRILSFFLFLSAFLCAEEESLSLVNLTKQPIPRVFGTVNVISGDWVDQEVHEQPTGTDSLPIGHSYVSSSLEEGSLSDGWDFLWPSTLEVYDERYYSESPNEYHHLLFLREGSGATLQFRKKYFNDKLEINLDKAGYTHMASIDCPISRDPRRIKLQEEKDKKRWKVTLSDGTIRFYGETKKHHTRSYRPLSGFDAKNYHIIKEVLPSKNIRLYAYDKDDELIEIATLSSCYKYQIQKITLTRTKNKLVAESMEGKKITFSLKDINNGLHTIVSSISRKDAPDRRYEYCEKSPRHLRRIEKRTWSTGRVEEAKFYNDSHDTTIDGEDIHQSSAERDFTKGRVREIRTKRFRGEELFTRHGFYYDRKGGNKYCFSHYPILHVTEPDDAFASFMLHDKRVIWLTHYNKKKERLAAQHFVWSDKGRLEQRILYDQEKEPLFVKEYVFDKRGFPIEEKNHGILTSKKAGEIRLKEHNRYDKGGETWEEKATWDDEGHLLSRVDADGNWTYFTYDRSFITKKFICSQKHGIYREFATYDTAGNLIELIQDDSSHTEKENLEGATKRSILQIEPRMEAPYFGEPLSKKLFIWTPKGGLQLKKTEYFHRDGKGRLTRHTERSYDGIKKETSFAYDELDRLIEKVLPDGSRETLSYDSESGLIRERTFPHKKETFTYDLLQRVISEKEIFPDGSFMEKTYDYDTSGRIITIRDSRNRVEVVEKDLLGRLVSKTHSPILTDKGILSPVETFTYKGSSVSHTSPEGAVTTTLVSSIGKPLEIIHPEGRKTTYRYDLLGREIERFDGERTIKTAYDTKDHVIKVETYVENELTDWQENTFLGDDCIETETAFLRTTFIFDQFGRCSEKHIIDKESQKEQVEYLAYDGFDRLTRRTTFAGDELFTYDAMDRIRSKKRISPEGRLLFHEKTSYDEAGRILEICHLQEKGEWRTTSTTYGAYGLPSSLQAPDGTTMRFFYRQGRHSFIKKTVDPLGVVIEEAFAPNDAVTRKTIFSPFGKTLSETRTTLTLLGKPRTISYDIYYNDTLEETLRTVLDYDALGRLVSVKEAVGTDEEVSSYKSYDAYNRIIEETNPSGLRITSSYDGKGRLTRKKSSDGSIDISFSYTANDLIRKAHDHVLHTETRRSYDGFGHLLEEEQSNGLKLSYTYENSVMTGMKLPDKTSVRYRYDGDTLIQAERRLADQSYSFSITKRNASGAILETSMPFSLGTISYTYDSMGRPLSKNQRIASDARVYDLIGRPSSRTIDTVQENFQYDDLSQLVSDNGKSYSYDSLYRLREKEGKKAQVTRRQQCIALGSKHFTYDLDGRRITDGSAKLTYDALGRLTSYTKRGVTERFEYDALSRLMKKTTPDSEERFLWMGQHEIGSFDSHGRALSFRLLAEGVGLDGGGTIAIELDGSPYACYTDLSGNIRALLDPSGTIVHTASYSSFSRLDTSGLDCPWGFFSKRHDELSGYVFFLYRLYDPVTFSWITQDPLGLEAGPNLYAYVKNNPLSLFDRFGLFGEGFCDSVGSFCSSCYDTVCSIGSSLCDGFRSAYESCCSGLSDFCSSISSALSSVCEYFSTSSSDVASVPVTLGKEDCLCYTAKGVLTDPNAIPNGNSVFAITRKSTSLEKIRSEIKTNPRFQNKIHTLENGMNTQKAEVLARAYETLGKYPSVEAIIVMYNETKGLCKDGCDATMTALRIRAAVVAEQKAQLMEMCDTLGIREEKMGITFHCHSEGAGIMNCILNSQEFNSTNGPYRVCVGRIYTYGGSVTIPRAVNFIARGDIVPFLNPLNWITMILHPECVHFVGSWNTPLAAHTFDGLAYQEAFQSTLR